MTRRRPVDVGTSAAIAVGGTLAGCVLAAAVYPASDGGTSGVTVAIVLAVTGLAVGIHESDRVSDSEQNKRRDAIRRGVDRPPMKWQD